MHSRTNKSWPLCVYRYQGCGGGPTRKARDRPLIRPILNDVSLRHKKPGNVIWAERAAYTTETKLLDFSKWKITNSPAYSLSDDMMAVIYMPRSLAYMLRRWTFIFIFIIRRLKLLQYTQSFGFGRRILTRPPVRTIPSFDKTIWNYISSCFVMVGLLSKANMMMSPRLLFRFTRCKLVTRPNNGGIMRKLSSSARSPVILNNNNYKEGDAR